MASNNEQAIFRINAKLIEELESGECYPVFYYPLKPSRSGQGKSAECDWMRNEKLYKSPQFLTGMEKVKFGAMPFDKRNQGKKKDMKDVPSIAFGTKTSGDFGEFIRLIDDVVLPKALAKFADNHFTKLNVELWNRRLSKDSYGSAEHPGDAEKKAKYLAEEDWNIAIKFKYNLSKPNGEGNCYARFSMGKKTIRPKGNDIDTFIRGGSKVCMLFKIDRAWVTIGSTNPKTKMTPYTLGMELFVQDVIINPREERPRLFDILTPEEQDEIADVDDEEEENESKNDISGIPESDDE